MKWDALEQVASYSHRNAGKGKGAGNPRYEGWHIMHFCSVPGDLVTVDGDWDVQTEFSSCPISHVPLWWNLLAAEEFNYLPCAVKWLKLRLFSSSTLAGHSHSGMTSCFNRSCLPRWQKPSSFFSLFLIYLSKSNKLMYYHLQLAAAAAKSASLCPISSRRKTAI